LAFPTAETGGGGREKVSHEKREGYKDVKGGNFSTNPKG